MSPLAEIVYTDGLRTSCCTLCDWWFPVLDQPSALAALAVAGVGSEVDAETVWKATAVVHGWLCHPEEMAEVHGATAEERLAVYRRELDVVYEMIERWATTVDPKPWLA